MTSAEFRKTFISFLKHFGAYEKFTNALQEDLNRPYRNLTEYLMPFNKEYRPDIITCTFDWNIRPGWHYWQKLDDKWRLFYSYLVNTNKNI